MLILSFHPSEKGKKKLLLIFPPGGSNLTCQSRGPAPRRYHRRPRDHCNSLRAGLASTQRDSSDPYCPPLVPHSKLPRCWWRQDSLPCTGIHPQTSPPRTCAPTPTHTPCSNPSTPPKPFQPPKITDRYSIMEETHHQCEASWIMRCA